MRSIEEDTARVEAVAAALNAPRTVWVFEWQERHNSGFAIYSTQQKVIVVLIRSLDEDWEDMLRIPKQEYEEMRKQIETGDLRNYNNDNDHFISYSEYKVL